MRQAQVEKDDRGNGEAHPGPVVNEDGPADDHDADYDDDHEINVR